MGACVRVRDVNPVSDKIGCESGMCAGSTPWLGEETEPNSPLRTLVRVISSFAGKGCWARYQARCLGSKWSQTSNVNMAWFTRAHGHKFELWQKHQMF